MKLTEYTTKHRLADIYPILVCAVLFILALNIRWRIFYDFCVIFTDSDQVLLWDAANDIHKGIFHEPCFYGQAYNPLIEPLFAQPFLFLKIPFYIALPLTSWIFGLFPYLLLGWAFFCQKQYLSVAFTFAYLLWLPIEFHAIDSIPRGFVPACAFASIGIYLVLFTGIKSRFFWFGFLSLFALTVSQNCIFLLVPVAMYVWLYNLKNLKFYLHSIAGLLVALPLPLYINWFYNTHPRNIVHGMEYTYDFDTFQETLKHTDLYLNYLTPDARYKLLAITMGYLFFCVVCMAKKNFRAGISILSGLAILYFSFWFDKAQDGAETFYFSAVRMYLGVPVAIIIFCYWSEISFKIKSYRGVLQFSLLTFLLVVGIICSSERNRFFKDKLYYASHDTDAVPAKTVDSMVNYCNHIEILCKTYHSNLVILDNLQVGIAYMCPALDYPFKILRPCYERRTWALQEEDTTIRPNFIYLCENPQSMYKSLPANIDLKPTSDFGAFLITTHGRKVFDILKDMKVGVRPH